MGTASGGKTRQRLVTTGLVSCLLVSGAVGLRPDNQATIRLGSSLVRSEYAADISGMADEANYAFPSRDVAVRSAGDYLETSSRLNYIATTGTKSRLRVHIVEPGDSLWLIAQDYSTDVSTLLSLNPQISGAVIQPGEALSIAPNFRGVGHVVREGETLSRIAAFYDIEIAEIVAANSLSSPDEILPDQLLLLPGVEPRLERGLLASRAADARRPTQDQAVGQEQSLGWIWPISGGLHTAEFGQGGYHSGIDIAVPSGTPVGAVAGGTVAFAGWDGGYGYSVILEHGNGLRTRYAHASEMLVTDGQWVGQGEQVILVGSTGNSTGPHLHFEVLVNGDPRNPRLYLP